MTQTAYNANNQLTNWKGATLTYDASGNLTDDGTNSRGWNGVGSYRHSPLKCTRKWTWSRQVWHVYFWRWPS